MLSPIRILIIGQPGTPIFEVGQRLSEFHELDFITIEQEPSPEGSYFEDKIPATGLDMGDFTDGSSSEHMARDPFGWMYNQQLDKARVPAVDDPLSEQELAEIEEITQGIVSTEIADEGFVGWATHVVYLDANEKEAIKWFSLRRKCPACGAIYHLEDKPPKEEGLCDRCGTDLVRKPEDDPKIVRQQYKYWEHRFWRMRLLAKKNRKFILIKVDEAKDFDEILNKIDKWVKRTTGINSMNWYYKPKIEEMPTLPANDLVSKIEEEIPVGFSTPPDQVNINIQSMNQSLRKEAIDYGSVENHATKAVPQMQNWNYMDIPSFNGFDVGQPVTIGPDLYVITSIGQNQDPPNDVIFKVQSSTDGTETQTNGSDMAPVMGRGNRPVKTMEELQALSQPAPEKKKIRPSFDPKNLPGSKRWYVLPEHQEAKPQPKPQFHLPPLK